MLTDSLNNPVTLQDPASLPLLGEFVDGFLSSQARAVNLLQLATLDASPIVQACCAALHLFAENADAAQNAQPFIAAARASPIQATPREQRFVQAVAAWAAGDIALAIKLHEEQAREHPRDLVSLKLGHYHLFNQGDAAGMLRIAQACQTQATRNPYFHGMLAFGYEQCHLMTQAEASAQQALALTPKGGLQDPWAHHALAHVMLAQGRHAHGQTFMREASAHWQGLNSFMLTHNHWHLALFALELNQPDEALRLYDEQVWGVAPDYSQDQINAVSLLARLELLGVDVGPRWHALATHLAPRTHDHVLPFLDLQYLYGLAKANQPQADVLIHNMQAHAMALPPRTAAAHTWQKIALPAARGLLAHAKGQWRIAAQQLGMALPQLQAIGGSHAQRDLFVRIQQDAAAQQKI
jgi:hypothetical protein